MKNLDTIHVFEPEESVMLVGPVFHMPSDEICRHCGREKIMHRATYNREGEDQIEIKYEPFCGDSIEDSARSMVLLATKHQVKVNSTFNDIAVEALSETDANTIVKFYHAECERRSAEYRASPEYAERMEQARVAQEKRTEDLRLALYHAPAHMTILPGKEDEYASYVAMNSKDSYSLGVVTYADRWARIMEARLASDQTIAECAKEASHLADSEGITGFMYGCAVSSLAKFWAHGEELRRWHNLDTQISTEGEKANESGGVLNPALLSLG